MDLIKEGFAPKVDLEELYQKCQSFDESALRMENAEYDTVLRRYLAGVAKFGAQLTEGKSLNCTPALRTHRSVCLLRSCIFCGKVSFWASPHSWVS